jgi:hypothetical protein
LDLLPRVAALAALLLVAEACLRARRRVVPVMLAMSDAWDAAPDALQVDVQLDWPPQAALPRVLPPDEAEIPEPDL